VHEFDAELQAAEAALDALQPEAPLPSLQKRSWQRRDVPGPAQWQRLVERVTDPAFQAHTPKVVLSRESLLESEESIPPLCPWSLLTQWARHAQECFHFGFQFSPEQSFIACSPERLYRREQCHLFTEALAGTIRRSGDEATDAALAAELLADSKNRLDSNPACATGNCWPPCTRPRRWAVPPARRRSPLSARANPMIAAGTLAPAAC